jgi:pullulanase/glycogen debranching enzyme
MTGAGNPPELAERIFHGGDNLRFGLHTAFMPRCRVVDPAFTWGEDRPPRTPWEQTVIYELHVRGYTKLHPAVPEHLRGTFVV